MTPHQQSPSTVDSYPPIADIAVIHLKTRPLSPNAVEIGRLPALPLAQFQADASHNGAMEHILCPSLLHGTSKQHKPRPLLTSSSSFLSSQFSVSSLYAPVMAPPPPVCFGICCVSQSERCLWRDVLVQASGNWSGRPGYAPPR